VNKPRTIEGRWWIFGRHRPPHFGVLKYDSEKGLILDVKIPRATTLPAILLSHTARGQLSIPQTVIGSDEHDKFITLFGCLHPGTHSSTGLLTITVRPIRALLGYRSSDWNKLLFPRIAANFSLLHNWIGTSRMVQKNEENSPTFSLQQRDPIRVPITTDVVLTIWPNLSVSQSTSGIELQEDHSIEIASKKGRLSPDQLLNKVHIFRRLLTLFTGRPVFVDEIWFYPTRSTISKRAELLHTNAGVLDAERSLAAPFMLISFQEIASRLTDILPRWYRIHSQLDNALNLYFATVFNPTLYMNHDFLVLAQSLEVYHRANPAFDNFIQPKRIFRERKRSILHAALKEKDWLNSKLAHANEKTLAQRLREIVATHPGETPQFISDPDAFVQLVKNTRNHFTHYTTDKKRMHKVASGVALMRLTDQMRTLLEISVFKDLGISGAPINRLIKAVNSRSYFSL
jgi:hypothetical protein